MYEVAKNSIEVHPNDDGTFDFRIRAIENGNILCGSRQGYVDRSEAEAIARRVTNAPATLTFTEH